MTVEHKPVTAEELLRIPDGGLRRERVEALGEVEGYWPETPDLVVEVVSPNDRFSEVKEEVEDWLTAGTRMVLVVNPRGKTVTVRLPNKKVVILTEEEGLDGGEVVPGWTLPVADVLR